MPNKLTTRIDRIKQVEREFLAARFATIRLGAELRRDPTILPSKSLFQPRDVRFTIQHIEKTYIIRLFAEFETAIRHFWSSSRQTDPPYRTQDLIDGVAARTWVRPDRLENTHLVRRYRNEILHVDMDGNSEFTLSISDARQFLCQFLSYLPRDW